MPPPSSWRALLALALLSTGCRRALPAESDAGATAPTPAWDCTGPDRCEQDLPIPDESMTWECRWTEFRYRCTGEGEKGSPPAVGDAWRCAYDEQGQKWECTRLQVPNPTDTPWGILHWKCKVDAERGKLVCEKGGEDDGNLSAPDPGTWHCKADGSVCEQLDDNNGLPPGGGSWKCHRVTKSGIDTWICYGTSPQGAPAPGGGGWTCVKVKTELGVEIHRCERVEVASDHPPGGGWWVCVKGSAFGGTRCTRTEQPPQPPGMTPAPGSTCEPGDRMWCDGLVYSGWGQVACDPATGTWETTTRKNGKVLLDCREDLAGGKVPDTVCACYHYFLNTSCCERVDCVVPQGTSGQVCPPSLGKLCDPCNPLNPECVEPGAKCVVTNAHETFCVRDCADQPCPAGYDCMTVKLKVGTTKQCVPVDMSCYY